MVSKKKRPEKPHQSVKLTADVVESARIVSALRDEDMVHLLSDLLRPLLKKIEDEELAKRTKSNKGKAP